MKEARKSYQAPSQPILDILVCLKENFLRKILMQMAEVMASKYLKMHFKSSACPLTKEA